MGDTLPTVQDMVEYYDKQDGNTPSLRTVYRWVKDYGYALDKNTGCIVRAGELPVS